MSKFVIIWTVAGLGKKKSEGISIESLLQDEHQLLPMEKVSRLFSSDQIRTEVLACRDFLLFPLIDSAINILGEMAIEVHGLPERWSAVALLIHSVQRLGLTNLLINCN